MTTPLSTIASRYGVHVHTMRRMILNGVAHPGSTNIVPRVSHSFVMHVGETVPAARERLLREFVIIDAAAAASFRQLLKVLGGADERLPRIRIEEALAVCRATPGRPAGVPVSAREITHLIGGSLVHTAPILLSIALEEDALAEPPAVVANGMTVSTLAAALCCGRVTVRSLEQFGLLTATRTTNAVFVDLHPSDPLGELRQRFWTMKSAPFGTMRMVLYRKVRLLLCIEQDDRHPPAFLDDVIDWLLANKQKPEQSEIYNMIFGNKDQIADRLRERHRNGENVVLPKRTTKRYPVSKEDLRAVVAPALSTAYRTWLDGLRGDETCAVRDVDIIGIIENGHPVLQQIAAVVALGGFALPAFKALRIEACIALRDLWQPMMGADPTNPSDVRMALEAQYHVAMAIRPGPEQTRLLNNIAVWPWVVTIFNGYRFLEGMPPQTAAYLASIAPVLPNGSDGVIKKARTALDVATLERRVVRITDMGELLDGISGFYPVLEQRRNATKAFRRRVLEITHKAEAWGMPLDRFSVQAVHTVAHEHGEPGRRKASIRFAVHGWLHVIARGLACSRELFPSKGLRMFGNGNVDADRSLFENRYVVEFISSTFEDGSVAPCPHWIEFHSKHLFHPVSELTTEQAEERYKLLADIGVSGAYVLNRGKALGTFGGGKKTIARHAERALGMTLLPLDEHDHWEAYAMYTVSSRLDEPVRVNEHLQFNIGSGLDSHEGDDGVTYTVLRAFRKKKPLMHDFLISRESEILTEELLTTTSRRKYGGGGIRDVPRPGGANSRSPTVEKYILAYGDKSLDAARIDVAVCGLTAKLHKVQGRDFKYLWNRLASVNGMTMKQRQEAQGHVRIDTTEIYNPPTPNDIVSERNNRRNCRTEMRARLLNTDVPPAGGTSALVHELAARAAALHAAIDTERDVSAREGLLREFALIQGQLSTARCGAGLLRKARGADDE